MKYYWDGVGAFPFLLELKMILTTTIKRRQAQKGKRYHIKDITRPELIRPLLICQPIFLMIPPHTHTQKKTYIFSSCVSRFMDFFFKFGGLCWPWWYCIRCCIVLGQWISASGTTCLVYELIWRSEEKFIKLISDTMLYKINSYK